METVGYGWDGDFDDGDIVSGSCLTGEDSGCSDDGCFGVAGDAAFYFVTDEGICKFVAGDTEDTEDRCEVHHEKKRMVENGLKRYEKPEKGTRIRKGNIKAAACSQRERKRLDNDCKYRSRLSQTCSNSVEAEDLDLDLGLDMDFTTRLQWRCLLQK